MTQLPARAADLPMSLVDIAETLGMGVAVRLMQHFGGLELKLPLEPGPDHPVIAALGEVDGRALARFLSGGQIYVPHGRRRKTVRAEVLDLAAKGHDRREIARMLGISQRHVRRAANRNEVRPPDLFD